MIQSSAVPLTKDMLALLWVDENMKDFLTQLTVFLMGPGRLHEMHCPNHLRNYVMNLNLVTRLMLINKVYVDYVDVLINSLESSAPTPRWKGPYLVVLTMRTAVKANQNGSIALGVDLAQWSLHNLQAQEILADDAHLS